MERAPASIRTPDQRLRVFVSSTLNELAGERKTVRSAIEKLRLAPVMFELGARPHAPRDLYRAYLNQSDVFVGLYWENYGWIAPGEEISGLEDEYRESGDMPRLIYIKEPAESREARLTELLDRIIVDGSASFKSFTTAQELGELLEADLATLLAERFDQTRDVADGERTSEQTLPPAALPTPLTEIIGREAEEQELIDLLERDTIRLVTLTGPGGIGKSRLAIDVAEKQSARFRDGVAFVSLANVQDPKHVYTAIAQAIGVRDTGVGTIEEKIATALRNREMLIVVDNFEQVVNAAPLLTALLTGAPGLKLLVTSRTVLRLTGEYAVEVGPLGLPDGRAETADVTSSAAVQLFVERARAVQPVFSVTSDNARSVARLCVALDGVPLALELAAARIRMLPPAAMLDRLDRKLPLLVGGVRDLPSRQQTLRNTIEWSIQLLEDDEKSLLKLLGVFSGPFSLEAAEYIAADAHLADPLASLSALVDNSLIRQQDRRGYSYFSMLSTVREYAREQLDEDGTHDAARSRHAEYYVGLGARLELVLEGGSQQEWVARLSDERANLRAAARLLLDRKEWETAATFAWTLYVYWWVGGQLGEVRGWMDEVVESGGELTDLTRAIALYFQFAITFWQDPEGSVVPGLTLSAELFARASEDSGEGLARVSLALAMLASAAPDPAAADDTLETALALFRKADDPWGEGMALISLGRVALLQQQVHRAINRFEESLALGRQRDDLLGVCIVMHHLGWAHLLLGDLDTGRTEFEESLRMSIGLGHQEGIAYGLEGLVAIAASGGEVERAGTLLGASEILREQAGLYNAPTFSFHQQLIEPLRSGNTAEHFERARLAGRALHTDEAVRLALIGRQS